jgi:hypothetical protein
MRFALLALLIPPFAAAQTPGPPGGAALTGTVLERDPQTASGEFSVRTATSQVFRYRFDSHTAVDRDSKAIDVARLRPGDRVEVISDQPPGAALRYAIAIHALAADPARRATAEARARLFSSEADRMALSGDLSLTGVVSRISGARLTLRLRDGREQALTLRRDTSYIAGGQRVDVTALKPATLVFVQAGRSLFDGEVEAYSVVWGAIMQPQ